MAPEVSGCPDPNPIKQISCCGGLWGNPGQEFANAICAGGRTDGLLGTREEKLRAPALARSTIAFLQIGALNEMHKPGRRGERERERKRERERERERERDSHPGESAHRNPVGGGGLGVIVAVPFEGHSAQSLPRVMQRIDPPRTPLPPPDPVMISSITA